MALIGLSSAVPTLPFMATGTLGDAQCNALADILPKLKRDGLFRVVLVHHPLHSEPKDWYKRLTDSERLRDVLRVHGAELVLHGHDHRLTRMPFEGPDGLIPAIGAPSASSILDDSHEGAAYNLFRIARVRDIWQCEMTTRGLTTPGELKIGELQKVRLG
jgi:3',5'-cyclic AMP phosphodiesterase CpdA